MAKTFVEDTEDHNRIPFLRGILIHSLQGAGLEFDSASHIASEIRHKLNDTALISTGDLSRLVLNQLKKDSGQEVAQRYLNRNMPMAIQVVQQCGRINPFSVHKFRNSLETIGLKPRESEAVLRMLQDHLANKSIKVIKSRQLAMLIYRYLRQSSELGPAVAHRWLVWHDFINSGHRLIFLIGGTAGSGKSTSANTLANRLEIVHTQSTDMLREIMRTTIPERLMPVLHQSSFNAWKGFPEQPPNEAEVPESLLIQGYRSQADLLSLAIEAVVMRATRERGSLILEGVHLHPALVENLQSKTDAVVIPVMLALLKRKLLQERIKTRSPNVLDQGTGHYLQHFDEIWRLQSYLLSEADHSNIRIVVNEDRDAVFAEIMRITIFTLAKSFVGTPEEVFGEKPL